MEAKLLGVYENIKMSVSHMEQGTQDIISTFTNTLLESNRPDIHVREDVLRYMLHNITQVCFETVFRVTIKEETIHQAYYMVPFETQTSYKIFSTTNVNFENCFQQMMNKYNAEELIKLMNNLTKNEVIIEKPVEKLVEKQVEVAICKPPIVTLENPIVTLENPVKVTVEKPVNKKPAIEIVENKKSGIVTKQNEIIVETTEEGNDKPKVIKLVEKIYKDKPIEMIENPAEHVEDIEINEVSEEESEESEEESPLNGMSSEELKNLLSKMKSDQV